MSEQPPPERRWHRITDCIETIMFGPGDLRFAHTDEEVVSIQEVRDAARFYAAAVFESLRL